MSRTISRPQSNTPITSKSFGTRTSSRARTASRTQAAINEDLKVEHSQGKKKQTKANLVQKARQAEENDYGSEEDDINDAEGRRRLQHSDEGDEDDDKGGSLDTNLPRTSHRSVSVRDVEESHAPKSRSKGKKRKAAPLLSSSSEDSDSPPPIASGRRRLVPHQKSIPVDNSDEQDVANSDTDERAPSRPDGKSDSSSTRLYDADKSAKRRKIAPSQNDTTIKIHAVKDIQDETLRSVMFVALRHHSARLVCYGPYPVQDAEKELIISLFSAAKKDFGALEYKLTKPLQSLLKNNKSTFRGRVRDAAQHFVPGEYGLGLLHGETLQAEQRRLLRDFAYTYKDDSKRMSPYLRPIVQQVVNRVLFSGRHPLAVEYPEYFGDALSTSALALILTSIHYSIARLNDPTVGKFSGIWATTYHEHLSRIHALDQESPDLSRPLMQRICKALLRNGRAYAQAEKKLDVEPLAVIDKASIKADAAELAALLGSDDDE